MPSSAGSQNTDAVSRQKVLARLMQKTARGDFQAFSMLYAMTSPQLYGVMLNITNYAQACEDLLQEVYLTVWRRADHYQPQKASVITWLVTIARNRTLDWLRSQGAGLEKMMADESPEALDLAAGNTNPEQMADSASRETYLAACLDKLSPQQRQAIMLAYLEGHSHAELAERLSSALGTVKSWIRRGLEKLKLCLQRQGGDS